MVLGALTRRKSKLLMIAFTVALGVSLATAMLNVMFDVGDKVNQELKTYGANLNVVPRGASLLSEMYNLSDSEIENNDAAKYIPEAELQKIKMIFWAYNIVDFAPYLETPVIAGDEEVMLVGTWFDKHLSLPTGDEVDTGMTRLKSWWDITGQPGDDADKYGALVGEALAARQGLKVGDKFNINADEGGRQAELTVRAIFHSGGVEDDQIFVPLALAQEFAGLPGLVQRAEAP